MQYIAEISANHLGSFDRALLLVEAAAQAGATAVKLQTWSEMVVADYTLPDGPWKGRKLADLYIEAKTPWEWHADLFKYAKGLGIDAFSSVFDLESLKFLESIGCPRYKISSFELGDLDLLQAVVETGKPMILSTGMASHDDVWRATMICIPVQDLTLLKCSSAYPAPLSELNLATIPTIAREFGTKVGFSDHTRRYTAAMAATALGAVMIEKHLTLRRSDGGPDAGFSTEPGEFYEMVQACDDVAQSLGKEEFRVTTAEVPQAGLKRSLFYARDAKAGDIVSRGTFVTARPGLGLEPCRLQEIIGRTLVRSVRYGEPVNIEDFNLEAAQ